MLRLGKVGRILANSLITLKLKEVMCLFILPFLLIIFIFTSTNEYIICNNLFINNFIDKVINITTLLSSFGLASLSILVSSSSKNIEVAQNTECENRKNINGYKTTYYQLQFYRSISGLLIQFIVLILAITFNFLFLKYINTFMYIFFYVILYLLIVSLMFQILSIVSIYYLFVNKSKQ